MSKIIITGGGVAGLSAGIYARLNGYEAVIYEKHHVPGGNLTGWDRGGYHIDNCIHWLTGTNPVTDMYSLWHDTGALGGVGIYHADSLYTYEHNGAKLSLNRDVSKLHADMLALSPRDEKEISSFIKALNAAKTIIEVSGKSNDKKAATSELLRSLPLLLRYHQLTTRELAERFRDPVIRGFLQGLFVEGFGALGLLVAMATFCSDNGDLPQGGSRAMALRMASRFRSLGGELNCGVSVTGAELKKNRVVSVTLSDGSTATADAFIFATDPAITFGALLKESLMPSYLRRLYDHASVNRFSSFHSAFACEVPELPFHDDRIFDLPLALQEKLRSKYIILREYSHEESFSPQGKCLIQTMHYFNEAECRRFIRLKDSPAEYRALKSMIVSEIEAFIVAQYPELQGKLSCIDSWTPATYKRYTGAEVGSYMGFAFPAKLNPLFRSGRIKGLDNAYLATQWQQAPGGLPVAAKAGKAAVEMIAKQEKRNEKE